MKVSTKAPLYCDDKHDGWTQCFREATPALSEDEPKLSPKELKRLLGMTRALDPWEQYRALNDAMDEAYELIDISNREARFALILMGGLNPVVLRTYIAPPGSDPPRRTDAR